MDGIVGKVGERFRISLTDSTMMKILHSAMDKSHARVKSEQGVILRLTEISKFYELAVMLLDGCLRFVGDETVSSSNNAMEESSEEDVVGELAEIRDRLRGRLRETELAIAEKDREFRSRFGDESPELKRFDSLGVDFRLEKLKAAEGNSEEEFSELQHSVDQQVMNIKQKLGPEYKMVEKRRNKSVDCLRIDQMSSDIDILKSTMDLAFGKMHSAISLSESEKQAEQRWGWQIESGTAAVLIRGFLEDLEEKFVAEVDRRGKPVSIALNVGLMDVMNELRCLQDESVSPRGRVREVLGKLDNLNEWYGKERESFDGYQEASVVNSLDKAKNPVNDATDASREELVKEIEMMQNGKEDLYLQILMMEKTYLALIEGMLHEFRSRLCDHDVESRIKEHIVKDFVGETVFEWNQKLGNERIEGEISEEVCRIALSEAMKEIGSNLQAAVMESQDLICECKLREETCKVLFRETCKDWNNAIERHEAECLGKEVSLTILRESLRDIAETVNHMVSSLKRAEDLESSQCIEKSVKEDICMLFLTETYKSWQDEIDGRSYEDFLKENIFRMLISEVIREANERSREEAGCASADDDIHQSSVVNVIQKPDSLVNVKKDLMPVGHSEMKLQKEHLCIGGMQKGEAKKLVASGKLLTEMKSNCSSVSSTVKQAIKQLVVSKRHLSEIRGSLGIQNGDMTETYDDHTVIDLLQREEKAEVKLMLPNSALEQIIGFSEVFTTFKCTVEERLGLNILRLQEAMQRSSPLVDAVASMKKKESQYAEAFIRQSENLKRAEIEVDLLGDQVDVLLGLLEKIYQILYHYSPILQQHFEVSDLLMMIKRELNNQQGSCL